MNIIKRKNWFFILSLLIIIPGVIALFSWGLKLGVDFSGGTLWELKITDKKQDQSPNPSEFSEFLKQNNLEVVSSASTGEDTLLVRLKVFDENTLNEIKSKIEEKYGKVDDIRRETVGPTVSRELTTKAFYLVGITIVGIVAYITWAFRKVPKPTSSLAFGVCTVIALVHDVIVVIGVFAILGHFLNVDVDSLFITALLTVLGFSVHDTIVVFDRIRENLRKYDGERFEEIVNHSILQTIGRSLNTSMTVVLVLLAMLLFGGPSIRSFVLALLIGIVSGTYSSIFNAAPLLVVWQNLRKKIRKN